MESNKINKVLFFFDSRATFSYCHNIIKIFKKKKKRYTSIVSGNYLEKDLGVGKKIFLDYKIKVNKYIKFKSPNKNKSSWPISMGFAISNYAKEIEKINPDIVILTGDRVETLSFCLAASYMNYRIAHVQAGDKSGHIDDLTRSVIAKYSHLHFAPSKQAVDRLKKWNENTKRIFHTGAPQLNDMHKIKSKNKKNKYYVVIFHPVLGERDKINNQMKNLLKFLLKINKKIYWIYPNNDYGYDLIVNKLNHLKYDKINIIKNLERKKFLRLLKESKGLIGNSSCGIIEASLYHLPVINIGNRQNGRIQTQNIINCKCSYNELIKTFRVINRKNFIKKKNIKNPYYKKNSCEKIFRLIFKYKKNSKLFEKY
jgi:GDP/UDP-N,N'-diacetylbacillosamine 2-epimerase (hydrolysing)